MKSRFKYASLRHGRSTSIQVTFYEHSPRYYHNSKVGGEGAQSLMDIYPHDKVSSFTQRGPRNTPHVLFDC